VKFRLINRRKNVRLKFIGTCKMPVTVFVKDSGIDRVLIVGIECHTELLGFGLFTSSGSLQNRKHDISETGSVSILR
jgi:hypothetical protein